MHTLKMMIVKLLAFSLFLNLFCCFLFCKSHASDTLMHGDTLRGNQTLVSPGGVFELGFFPNGNVPKQYLGIWFKNDKYKKAVWVSNQDNPLVDNSASMYINDDGNLVISDIRGLLTVVNEGSNPQSNNTSCKLLDSGNLVLMEGKVTVWESFDWPTDTFLPGMKLGKFNLDRGHIMNQYLTSWLTPLDPTKGNFIFGMDADNRTQFKIWGPDRNSLQIGYWNGQKFILFLQTKSTNYNFSFVSSSKEIYLTFSNTGNSNVPSSWFEVAPNGEINELIMVGKEISVFNHSTCNNGFATISTECLKLLPPHCWNGDDFSEITGMLPNSMTATFPIRMGLDDCELTCKSNCSCMAYASYHGDSHMCWLYFGDKKTLQKLGRGSHSIYVRGDAMNDSDHRRIRNLLLKILVPILSILTLFTVIIIIMYSLRRRNFSRIGMDMSQSGLRKSLRLFSVFLGSKAKNKDNVRNDQELSREDAHELPLLSFSCISNSTDGFSLANKLGEGGFGPVYKGKLQGQDIAVKRLSKSSGQGFEEFRNEVHLISELQHRNLVKLLGYCIHQEEKILIYEYMPNKSLDSFIFDSKRGTLLDWGQRMHIIEGIAQGLLYLHKYSRLRVIHRDLKTSNILLDTHMSPKISDFGMARICDENQSQGITKRVAGTYGYMSPEYAVHGRFSTKSDVFSYGVMLLEIVSGQRNTFNFEYFNHSLSLLGYAWNLWKDDRSGELMDLTLANSCRMNELQLCIQVALLCVQENPEDRPAMSDVVSMLANDRSLLPAPKQPALSTYLSLVDIDSPRRLQKPSQISVTISSIEAR